jgi:hypothetical protein
MVAALAVDTRKGIASQEEVRNRQVQTRDWLKDLAAVNTYDQAIQLWNEARTHGASQDVLDAITAKGKTFGGKQ